MAGVIEQTLNPDRKSRLRTALVLALLAALLVLTRLHTYSEPFERDLTTYAVNANEMLAGRPLYTEVVDNKPPGIFLTYALAQLIVGYGPAAINLLAVISAVLCMIGVFFAAALPWNSSAAEVDGPKPTAQSLIPGLWAASFWVSASGDLRIEGNQPNTEVFINACLIGAFAILVRGRNSKHRARYIFAGVLFALASYYKQVAVLTAAVLAVVHLIFPPPETDRKTAMTQVFWMALPGFVLWSATFAYFAVTNRFDEFYGLVFGFNGYYSQNVAENFTRLFRDGFLLPDYMRFTLPMLLAAFAGIFLLRRSAPRRSMLLFGWLLSVIPQIAATGLYFPHYYQIELPALVVGAAWLIGLMARSEGKYRRIAPHVLGGLILATLVGHVLPSYGLPAEKWSTIKYENEFVDVRDLGHELDRTLRPEETFLDLTYESGLYFYSGRRPPTGAIHGLPYFIGPMRKALNLRLLAGIERRPPELVVIGRRYWVYNPLIEWIVSHYKPYPPLAGQKQFFFYALRGGRLSAELRAKENVPGSGP